MKTVVVCWGVLVASCRREDATEHAAVFGVRPIPMQRAVETKAGTSVQIGLQAVDAVGVGVDGAEVMFFCGEGDLSFVGREERTVRIKTALTAIDGVSTKGLATVSVQAAASIMQETKLHVYASLIDDFAIELETDASVPEPNRFDVVDFVVTVRPAEATP